MDTIEDVDGLAAVKPLPGAMLIQLTLGISPKLRAQNASKADFRVASI